jgi:hypothetical protein
MAEENNLDVMKHKKKFEEDLATSKKFMDPIHAKMDIYYEMYRNRLAQDNDQMRISDLHAYVETVVPIITNNRTRAYVKAEDPEHIKHAVGLEFILDNTFDMNDWDYIAQRIVRMAEIYRSGVSYTGYDEKAEHNTGKLIIKSINPRWCYFDPASIELEDSSFFFYIEPMRASKVKAMYPDKADKIGKDREEHSFNEKQNGWFKSLLNTIKGYLSIGQGTELEELSEEEKRKNAVAFIHYWYRDDDDKWRVSYWADDVFLEDLENPFWHEQLPYDIFSPTEDILSVFGVPMAEQLEDLAYEKNILLKMFVKNAKKAVDPTLLYNASVGISDPRELKRKADDGIVGINNPDNFPLDTVAAYMSVPGVPNWASEIPSQFSRIQDEITGVNDSFRGMSEATSGKEVQLKQEAAYTRIKTKVDNFEKFVKNIARKTIVNAMQFIDTDTQFRVKGDYRQFEGQEENLPFDIEKIQTGETEEGPQYDRSEFFLYANPHEWTKVVDSEDETTEDDGETTKEEVEQAIHILNMIVEIEAGSSLPVSRQAKREETLELFSQGIVDQQYVLEQFDIADAEEILQRMNEQMEKDKEREAQMAQIPPVPQGGIPQVPQAMPQGMPNQSGLPPELQAIADQFRQQLMQSNPEAAQQLDDIQLIQLLQEIQQGGQQALPQEQLPVEQPLPNGAY